MAWGRIDDRLWSSRKWRRTSKGGRALWTSALSWCREEMSEGIVPSDMLRDLDGTKSDVASLVANGLWHAPGHDCDRCPEIEDGYVFHDWLDFQPSRAQEEAKRHAATQRQQRARARTKATRESQRDDTVTHGDRDASITLPPYPYPITTNNSSSETADAIPDDEPQRDDVNRLCAHLADRIQANGSKRPTITKAWRDAARLMLDRDHRTETQIAETIDWSQDDEFWRANILSMPTLRKQFDRLRLAAQRPTAASPSDAPRPGTSFWGGQAR